MNEKEAPGPKYKENPRRVMEVQNNGIWSISSKNVRSTQNLCAWTVDSTALPDSRTDS